jgi:tetratricopeptide (TPR) repeat protein
MKGDYASALADFKTAVDNMPLSIDAMQGLAVTAARLKQADTCLDALEQMLRLYPSAKDWAIGAQALAFVRDSLRFKLLIRKATEQLGAQTP